MSDLISLLKALIADLLAIYTTSGQEVTYVTDSGETKKYFPKRYLQAVKRAIENDEVLEFVERLVTRDAATRGFGYLQEANRLDLTVEALVVDESKSYHSLFSKEAISASQARLDHAVQAMKSGQPTTSRKVSSKAQSVLDALVPLIGGSTELLAQAERVAAFEGDEYVRSPHVLEAAASYMRRNRKGHDSV